MDAGDATIITTNCNVNEATKIFEVLDMIRENFLISFCPEIKPIQRCLVSYVQECYTRFTASFDFASKADMCM